METGTIYEFKNHTTHKDSIIIWDGTEYTSACYKWNKSEKEKRFKTKLGAILYCFKYISKR